MANIKKLNSNLNTLVWNDTTKLAPSLPFTIAAGLGLIPLTRNVRVIGENPDVDTASVPESIWMGGGIYTFASALDFYNIVSTSVEDGPGGSGALTVRIEGLDENFLLFSEELTLNGTTDVSTTVPCQHVQSITVLTAGSAGANVGVLTAIGASSTLKVIEILALRNKSAIGSFMVPANETWYADALLMSLGKQASVTGSFTFRVKPFGGVFETRETVSVHSESSPFWQVFTSLPVFPPKTQVRVDVDVSANNTSAATTIELFAIDEQIGV